MPDDKETRAILNRLSKAIGHTQSIKRMVEDGRDCSEVLVQLAAVRAAVNNAGKEILRLYMDELIQEAAESKDTAKMKELSKVIETFIK